jgi:hypothetical protein
MVNSVKDEIDQIKSMIRKFRNRHEISGKKANPHLIQVNGHELYPIFADVRDHILVTGQSLSSAPVYAINLTKQLLLKKHVIHAKTTYVGARALWNLLFCFGFLTEKTSRRLVGSSRFKKNAPRFKFHLYHDKHHIVEDTVNDGNLTALNIGDDEPVDVVFYLNQHADESFGEILRQDQSVDKVIVDLIELRPSLITRLTMQLLAEDLPAPSELPPGFNHIIVIKNASPTALKYKNRLHLRDVFESFKIYFPDAYNPGWRLHQRPLGHWCVITPGTDPIIQRAALKPTPHYFSWRKADGQ